VTAIEEQIAREAGISIDQLGTNEIARRLFDRLVEISSRPQDAVAATRAAMDTADSHADPEWKQRFYDAIQSVARRRAELTSDDVLAHCERLADPPKTHNLAAIGPAMIRAMKAGIIEPTGRVERSLRPEKHGNRQNVWRSKICSEGGSTLCLF
jgi:hypothetical protein